MSPYGSSKLMTEIMLRDAGAAHGLRHVILRYFNVAGADPPARTGQSTKGATHLIKVAVETALGMRPKMDVFGTDYPTPDGTCIRDYIHVSDLVARAFAMRCAYLRAGGASVTLNCGYGRGFSVLEVIDTVKRVSGVDFRSSSPAAGVGRSGPDRRRLRPRPRHARLAAAFQRPCKPSSATRWPGSASFRNAPAVRKWPAPGSEDTELGVLMEPEVGHGETEVYTRVQA